MARTKDFNEQEVLSKAMQIFWHKGYNATSMQDLVDGLGISRSSLYDTYTDKHTLYIKALESYQNAGADKFREIITSPAPAKEIIKKLLMWVGTGLLDDKQQKGCFMVNAEIEVAPHDAEVSKIICQNDQQIEDSFYYVIQKGKDNGEITNQQDTRALARFIFNTVKGMRVTAKSTTDKTVFDDIISLTITAIN